MRRAFYRETVIMEVKQDAADPSGDAVKGVGLRRPLAATVGSYPAEGMDACFCECCVLSGRGPCDGPITRPEYPYRVWCI